MIAGYAEKYFTEFTSDSYAHVSMGAGQVYRVSFLFRGFSGSAAELYGAETTVSRRVNEGITGVKTTEAKISLVVDDESTLSDFYTEDDRQVLVVLAKLTGTSPDTWQTVFTGWLTPWDAKEPYAKAPYSVELSATCGLGGLQDFYYDAMPVVTTVHDVLYTCLLKTGYELPLRVACYIYEESHLQNGSIPAGTFNPLKNIRIDTQQFVINKTNCFEILSAICDAGFVLIQQDGAWCLKLQEHNLDYSSDFRWLTYSDAADEAPALTSGDIRKDVLYNAGDDDLLPLDGGSLGIEQSVRNQTVVFDYGNPVNRLRNGFFSSGLSSWVLNPNTFAARATAAGDGTEEDPYRIRINGNAYQSIAGGPKKYIKPSFLNSLYTLSQTFSVKRDGRDANIPVKGWKDTNTRHILNLELEYVNYNLKGPLLVLAADVSGGRFYLNKTGTWEKKIEDADITGENIFTDTTGKLASKATSGASVSLTATAPVPSGGDYTITLYIYQGIGFDEQYSNAYIDIRNVRITIEDEKTVVATKERVNVEIDGLSPIARKKQDTLTLKFGDQTSYHQGSNLRYGAFLRIDTTPTKRWTQRIKQSGVFASRVAKWQNHTAIRIIRMKGRLGAVYEGDLLGDIEPLDLPRIQDLDNKLFLIDSWERNDNRRTNSVRIVELLDVQAATKITGKWESSDGAAFDMPAETVTYLTDVVNAMPSKKPMGGLVDTGAITDYIRSKLPQTIQGKVVPAGYNPNSGVSGHVINDSGAIVQTVIPNEWLFLSQTL